MFKKIKIPLLAGLWNGFFFSPKLWIRVIYFWGNCMKKEKLGVVNCQLKGFSTIIFPNLCIIIVGLICLVHNGCENLIVAWWPKLSYRCVLNGYQIPCHSCLLVLLRTLVVHQVFIDHQDWHQAYLPRITSWREAMPGIQKLNPEPS